VGSVDLASLVCSNSATRLLAGQDINVGTIQVTQDEQYLCVSFQITDSAWYIEETHLALAASPDLLPQTGSGNPQVGQFPYSHTGLHAQSDLFCVDYAAAGYTASESIYVAAHAVVVRMSGGSVAQSETAWGEGDGFSGRNWAMYFDHTLESCNHAPVAACEDILSECPVACDAVDAGSHDPDGADDVASITCNYNEAGTTATVVITDQAGLSSSCTAAVDLGLCHQNQPPVAVCQNVVAECPLATDSCGPIDGGSHDPDGADNVASLTCSYSADGTQATLTITDLDGLSSSCTATLEAADASAPTLSLNTPLLMVQPYDYRLHQYSLASCVAAITDNCDDSLDIEDAGTIVSISSDEPVLLSNHPECFDPDYDDIYEHCTDIEILDNSTFRIRNTRDSYQNGRVYTVTFTVTDSLGNTSDEYACQYGVALWNGQVPVADAPFYTIYP
jgi:hypothetical protein